MKTKIKAIAAVICLILISSCTKNFEDLNTDPNRIEKVTPGSLVIPTVYGMGTYFTTRSYNFTWELMQVGMSNPSVAAGAHRYDIQENAGYGTWNTCYNYLKNVKEMEDAAEVYGQPVYKAVAITLKAYIAGILTDCFGDIPFSEALKAEEEVTQPRFDTQQEVYESLISQLEEANMLYQGEGDIAATDILYKDEKDINTKEQWRKFNNSLLMRMILRLSKRAEFNSYSRLAAMIADPAKYPVFNSNAESALIKVKGEAPYNYAWGRRQDYVNFTAMGEYFVDLLNSLEDPRRALFMTQATRVINKVVTPIGFKGIPAGHSGDASQFDFNPSTPNGDLMYPDSPGTEIFEVLMSYAEVEFIKAEVAFKNGDEAAAKAAYEKGVRAAITQWKGGVVPANYFDNATANYNGTFEQIMNQKYLALFFCDYQQWFEYRRTGFPVLPKTPYMLHNGVMPTRFMYHNDVRRFNPENYKIAADRIGGDDVMTKVWWEK